MRHPENPEPSCLRYLFAVTLASGRGESLADGPLLAVLAVAVVGGGAAFYFKVYRPKQQAATEPEEDYGEELEDYDGEEDGPPWDEDEDENEDTEDGE